MARYTGPMTRKSRRLGTDLVGNDNAHDVVLPEAAALHLEIDQADAGAEEQARQEVVDADGERNDVVDLLGRRPAEHAQWRAALQRIRADGRFEKLYARYAQ